MKNPQGGAGLGGWGESLGRAFEGKKEFRADMAGRQQLSLKEYRKRLRKLQRAGLVSSRIDAKHHKPTSYMRAQLRKYDDVISGAAKTLQTNTRSTAEQIAREYGQVSRKGKTIIVPVVPNTKSIRYDLKTKRIKRRSKKGPAKETQIIPLSKEGMPKTRMSDMKDKVFVVRFAQHGSVSFDDWNSLARFMSKYESHNGGTWNDWIRYVEIYDAKTGGEIEIDPSLFEE